MFRYEQKYLINWQQYRELRQVLNVMSVHDRYAGENGEYMIRSLYFDDMYRSAYHEKQDGIYQRKKYRVRVYGCSDHVIHLECKHKEGAYIYKESCSLTRTEYEELLSGEPMFLLKKENQMAKEFCVDFRTKLLKPDVIVDYEREPFVFDAGTVRITFDKHVRAVSVGNSIFSADAPSLHVLPEDSLILEIKFTGYLPERIQQIFKVRNLNQCSASKFCLCADKIREPVTGM